MSEGIKEESHDQTSKTSWYKQTIQEGLIGISFQQQNENWAPDILSRIPLDTRDWEGAKVRIEGKGPLWMYAHVAVLAVRARAVEVSVCQPQENNPIVVYPLSPGEFDEPDWLDVKIRVEREALISFKRKENVFWSPENLPSLLKRFHEVEEKLITITGPGPNWLYSAVAALLAEDSEREIHCYAPRLPNPIRIARSHDSILEYNFVSTSEILASRGGRVGVRLGVVGDPNSGKSVFSSLLLFAFRDFVSDESWRLDCDHQAPTPDWYIRMLILGLKEEAKKLREEQKLKWTSIAEKDLAAQLNNCARTLDWVIADFPGGKHTDNEVERIPGEREVLIGAADYIIILTRDGRRNIEEAWREELREHGLENKVIGVISSESPDEPLQLEIGKAEDIVQATIRGLKRENLDRKSGSLQKSLPQFEALTDQIVRVIQQRKSSTGRMGA